MECVATESDEVVSVATPDALSDPIPIAVEPSLNVTVPVGTPVVELTTDAVR